VAEIPKKLLKILQGVTAKRAKTVIDHIIEHGHITTVELKDLYGYNHPPRAARDVREQGIPLDTFRMKGKDGRPMAAYRFADLTKIENHKLGGRQVFPKLLKTDLYAAQDGRCAICNQGYEDRYLQVDHRVPYEVAGDRVSDEADQAAFMLICGSCQRSKSWTCEHCENWLDDKDSIVCLRCYWASPTEYTHAAMRQERRVDIVWAENEIKDFERIRREAEKNHRSIGEEIKRLIQRT
jgi:hypothetical protein